MQNLKKVKGNGLGALGSGLKDLEPRFGVQGLRFRGEV